MDDPRIQAVINVPRSGTPDRPKASRTLCSSTRRIDVPSPMQSSLAIDATEEEKDAMFAALPTSLPAWNYPSREQGTTSDAILRQMRMIHGPNGFDPLHDRGKCYNGRCVEAIAAESPASRSSPRSRSHDYP